MGLYILIPYELISSRSGGGILRIKVAVSYHSHCIFPNKTMIEKLHFMIDILDLSISFVPHCHRVSPQVYEHLFPLQ